MSDSVVSKLIKDRELFLFCALFIALPVSTNVTSWCMWAIVAVWIIDRSIFHKLKKAFTNRLVLIYLLPVVLLAITLTYTTNFDSGLRSLTNKLFLILFPVVISTFDFTRGRMAILLKTFVLSIVFWSLFCVTIGIYNFFTIEATFETMAGDAFNRVVTPWNFLTNIQLVEPISISPIYMSCLTGLASIILVFIINHLEDRVLLKRLWLGALIYLFAFNVLLGARMGLISLLVSLPFFYSFSFIELWRAQKLRIIIVLGVSICLMVGLFIFNPILQKRFGKDLVHAEYPRDVTGWNSVNLRAALWDCGMQAAEQKIVLGYGLGSEDVAREECYKTFSFYGWWGTDLNSHNQYLEYLLIGGILLLAGFLFSLATSVYYAWSVRCTLLLTFVIFISLNFVTESFLAVQKGIIIYSLFCSLFTFGSGMLKERQVNI